MNSIHGNVLKSLEGGIDVAHTQECKRNRERERKHEPLVGGLFWPFFGGVAKEVSFYVCVQQSSL